MSKKNLSEVWNHFKKDDTCEKALCKYCTAKIGCKGSSTSGLIRHLSAIHPEKCIKGKGSEDAEFDVKKLASSPVVVQPRAVTANLATALSEGVYTDYNKLLDEMAGLIYETKRSPSPDNKICLKWNTYHNNIQAIFPTLLLNEQFVDVTLACEGRFMKCHKVILSACSPYFEELLSQNPCQHPIVLMKDIKFWEIRALVEFMYSGEVNVAEEKLPSLLRAAEALQVKGLTSVPPTVNNDSADSEDIPLDKVKEFRSPKNSRRKRKLSDSTGKSNESSLNDVTSEKKLFKDEISSSQPVPSLNNETNSSQAYDLLDSSNHPPISNQASSTQQKSQKNTTKEEDGLTVMEIRFSTPDEEKEEQISDESSMESFSEDENYIFNMGKRPVADQAMNLRRHTRQEKKPIERIQSNAVNK